MKNKIEIYFPIIHDYIIENYDFEQKNIIISEIKEVLEIACENINEYSKVTSIETNIKEQNEITIAQHVFAPHITSLKEKVLSFEINIEVDLSLLKVTLHEGGKTRNIEDKEELKYFLPSYLSETYETFIFEILILSQIIRPGSLKLRRGSLFINEIKQYNSFPNHLNIRSILELQQERNYPNILYIELKPFYEWITKNDLLFKITPQNSYQKALNNLSYVFGLDNDIEGFVYQMRILEEIYTDNLNQIADQLNTKIQIFLGKMETFKKQIKNMYNIRSRFLHGESINAPFHKQYCNENMEGENYEDKIYEAKCFSLLLIISTLQRMYLENRLELNYELKVTPNY